ncbi:MAG: hypothetical protein IKG21_03080 [Atopobiaceae bacterium]|nr:hypothetical protein [Atopobiaceae bacterium]
MAVAHEEHFLGYSQLLTSSAPQTSGSSCALLLASGQPHARRCCGLRASGRRTGHPRVEWDGYVMTEDGGFPKATSSNGKWWSNSELRWFTAGEIHDTRSGMADTYRSVGDGVDIPTAKTGLVYNGAELIGIESDGDYTLVGTTSATDAGDYVAKATLVGNKHWYDGTTGDKIITWSIARRPVLVQAVNKTKAFGEKDPALTAKVTGLVGSDKVVYALDRKSGENVGTYAILVTGNASQGNYEVIFESGAMSITKAASTIGLAAQTKTYNGKAQTYTGKVTRSGSAGKVTYKYYSDAKCTKAVAAVNVKSAKTYYVKGTLAADANHAAKTSAAAKLVVAKAAQPMTAKAANRTASLATLKTKAVTVARPIAIAKAQGTLSYAKVASGSSAALTVNKTTGKVTVKRGTKKGTYAIKIKVTAAGNANYKAGSKTVTCKVVVK